MSETDTRLRAFLAHLDMLDDEDRHDATVSEMMETDGFFYNRGKGRPWVVTLHDIAVADLTMNKAITAWICAAREICPPIKTEDDGFVTAHPDMAGGQP